MAPVMAAGVAMTETTPALQMAQWTGLNENWRSQAEMAALSQKRDADVGWREK